MILFSALLFLAVSYSRDVAPIFAMHCNSCHGDSETAGGLVTRTHADLLKAGDAIVPGDPGRSQIVQFIEGRRGERHRMPLGGAPLTAGQIALIRRWIAEGAKIDADSTAGYKSSIPKAHIRRSHPLQIECTARVPAYLILGVLTSGRILFERRATIKTPKDRGDTGAPGEPVFWTIWPEKGWPSTVDIEIRALYASEDRAVACKVASS